MTDEPPANPRPRSRRALGRGLDALLPPAQRTGVQEVDVNRIAPNPNQPRQRFDRKALEELAMSIRDHGVVQPLLVMACGDDRYQLIVGERRLQAARLAGIPLVPVVVKEASDRQLLELALVENLQRADLNPLEEAGAYQRLIQDFGLSQQEVARQVGKSRVAVANTLRLLSLPDELKGALVEDRITEGHARALLAVPDRQVQLALLQRVERDDLNVRQTEELVRRLAEPAQRRERTAPPGVAAVEDELRRALGTRVSVRSGKRGGRIVIEYYSDEEFQGLYDRLVGRG
ncbi:MAG: ParB/RepB/Spo0J family partition protein [Chloroflexi bacterium]|nr:ParB/RepB/Spo0J family partition protein [Chloroflexota bacterium]